MGLNVKRKCDMTSKLVPGLKQINLKTRNQEDTVSESTVVYEAHSNKSF